ncbi:hypothetical protein V8J88_16945 [Massilia sp. W12]|uniref:hypothetical protein n=1 Tax=Massilia sp. W12 TaxID=3126507 RepID=UPI0030D48210
MKPGLTVGIAAAALFSLTPAFAASASANTLTPQQEAMRAAAASAREDCHDLMHDDAHEYDACLQAHHANVKGRSAKAQQERMGILYFAWIGAANSARTGLPGAEKSAHDWLPRMRKQQSAMKLSDHELCPLVEGDCKSRVALILQMEKELQQKPAASAKKATAKP